MTFVRKDAERDLLAFLKAQDAYWKWDNHQYLALLTSGKVSDVFVNCSPVFAQPDFQNAMCNCLVAFIHRGTTIPPTPIAAWCSLPNTWVIGSAMGAIGLAQNMAALLACNAAFTEPNGDGMDLKRFNLGHAPHVLLVEDVFTTGGTTRRTMAGILRKHPDVTFYSHALALVSRQEDNGALLELDPADETSPHRVEMWGLAHVLAGVWDTLADVPEKMRNCEAVRPKEYWDKLTKVKLAH